MFFVDLVKHYANVLPPTIAKKKVDTERKVPLRKRTAPVDMRMSRSRLSAGTEARDWLANQRVQGNVPPPIQPPVPPVPQPAQAPAPPMSPAPQPQASEPEPGSISTPPVAEVLQVPPPPPLPSSVKPTPAPEPPKLAAPVPVPAARMVNTDAPSRPAFKSPPPKMTNCPQGLPSPRHRQSPNADRLRLPPLRHLLRFRQYPRLNVVIVARRAQMLGAPVALACARHQTPPRHLPPPLAVLRRPSLRAKKRH